MAQQRWQKYTDSSLKLEVQILNFSIICFMDITSLLKQKLKSTDSEIKKVLKKN